MKPETLKPAKKHSYLPEKLNIESWRSIEPYFQLLVERHVGSAQSLSEWLLDRSELEEFLEEDLAWRYIRMNCNTSDKELADRFNYFVTEIEPHISIYSNILDRKFIESPHLKELDQKRYLIPIRAAKNRIKIFREENVPLLAQLQVEEQKYGNILSKMTVTYKGRELRHS